MSTQLHQSQEQAPNPVSPVVTEVAPLPPTPEAQNLFQKFGNFLSRVVTLPQTDDEGVKLRLRADEAQRAETGEFNAIDEPHIAMRHEALKENNPSVYGYKQLH